MKVYRLVPFMQRFFLAFGQLFDHPVIDILLMERDDSKAPPGTAEVF